jgi:hypothetical protein
VKLVFGVWADDMRLAKEERLQQKFFDQLADQDKAKKQQMERMVANMFGRNEKQLRPQVMEAWKGILYDAKIEKKANFLIDMQDQWANKGKNRYILLAMTAIWRSVARDTAHIKALEELEQAFEEERAVLRKRCEEWNMRTQQAEQESIRALALQAEAVREADGLKVRLGESERGHEQMQRELSSVRVQVHEHKVRTLTMQRNQAAMAVLNVSHEEAREVLDAQLAELHVEREAMLDTTAELRRERANRRQLEGHLDDFLKDGVHSAIHSTDDYSPTTTKPSATLRRLRGSSSRERELSSSRERDLSLT